MHSFAKQLPVWCNAYNFLDLGGWPGVPPGALCLTLENFYMKKTLVALAVLAASGASFAQATITGQYGYGFKSTTTGSATTSGLGTSDANVNFSASEDLGGGMKVAANVKIDHSSRVKIAGGDDSISLSGNFGTLSMGNVEYDTDVADQFGPTFLGGGALATAGLVDSERTTDFIQYSTSFGPVGLSVRHTEGAAGNTLGTGAAGSGTAQRLNTIAGSYAAGPLSVKADYSTYDNKPDGVNGLFDNRTTLGGSFNLGVATVAVGFQKMNLTGGQNVTDSIIGVSGSFGAWDLGLDFMASKLDSDPVVANNKTYNGTGFQAKYNLSKRTLVRIRYSSADATLNNADKTNSYAVALYHNF
jgi:predicted porin